MTSPFATKFVRSLLACSILIGQQPAFASPAPAAAQTFDLGSATRTQSAPCAGAIMIGGARIVVQPGQMLTPAELAALRQVSLGGHQDLVVGVTGAAVGGRFNVDSALKNAGNLVIPNGVAGLANFSTGSVLDIVGNLANSGNLYAFAAGTSHGAGTIHATNIFNAARGTITSVLPASLALSLSAAPQFDLSLSAVGDIVNNGTITSSGSLGLQAGSGIIRNAGLMSAVQGSVSVTDDMRNVVFDNSGGTVQAVNGCINIHTGAFTGNGNITLKGGDWISQNLNLNAGGGDVLAAVNNVNGQVNTQAGSEHLLTSAPNLVLGSNTITGDPTFVNSGGNIVINGTVGNSTEAIAIIAAGNITAGANGEVVNHGYNVTLVAGAQVTVTGGTTSASGSTGPGSLQLNNGSVASVDFTAGSGGDINLSGSSKPKVIDTSGVVDNAGVNPNVNAGNILLAAYAKGITGGGIFVNTAANVGELSASGGHNTNYGGNGGNITIIAGGNPATLGETVKLNAIQSGVDGTDSGRTGGNIFIVTAQPMGSNPSTPVVLFDSHGAIDASSLSDITWTPTLQLSTIPLVRPNAQIHLFGPVQTAPLVGGTGGVGTNVPVAGANAGSITIYAGHNITAGVINASGGGGGGGGGGLGGDNSNLGANGADGAIGGNAAPILVSSALGDVKANTITASGGAGGGGGGGGGAGAPGSLQGSGGSGGTGGQAAQITVQAGGVITIGALLSSGGANGGNGGNGNIDPNNVDAGGGGGAGGGGASGGGTSSQGGGGGGGGQGSTSSGQQPGGIGGAGGVAGSLGAGSSNAKGGGVGTAFGATGGTGGLAGNGPSGSLSGNPGGDGLNTGVDTSKDVTPTVQLYGGTTDQKYLQDANYQEAGNGPAPPITPRPQGSNINVTNSSPLFSSPAFGAGHDQGLLFIEENGGLTGITGSTSQIVAAEWVAVNQVVYAGATSNHAGQTLVLAGSLADGDVNAKAVGGSFMTNNANIPGGGFFSYTLPVGVTNNVSATTLPTSGITEIDGNLKFTDTSGGTLLGEMVRVGFTAGAGSATLTSTGNFLTIQANAGKELDLVNTGIISNSHVINVTGAVGQSLILEGDHGVFDSPSTIFTSNKDVSFFSVSPVILTFKGTLTMVAGAGSTIGVGNTGDAYITANKYVFNSGQISGDPGNLHLAGSTGSYVFSGGTLSNPNGNITLPKNITTTGDLAILASGDVIAGTGATKLTATGKLGQAASSVTIVAGFDFSGQSSPTEAGRGTYSNFSPNAGGGSVYLGKMSIDTSTKDPAGNGGKVLILANSGTQSPGSIYLGTITTTGGTSGNGGAVELTAGGGINVGAITTKGATGGDVTLQGTQPTGGGTLSISNGSATGAVTVAAPSAAYGAGVIVNGAITTSASGLSAGNVVVIGDAQVRVLQGITANGTANGAKGGSVSLGSLNSVVSVLGTGINSSGASVNNSGAAGDGGTVTIGAFNLLPTAVELSNLVSNGGGNSGTGGGGKGGSVSIQTYTDTLANGRGGPVTLSGYLDTRGGAETSAIPTANTGAIGGDVIVKASLLAVKGAVSGASIISSGGAGSKGQQGGHGGNIDITTYAVQSLPSAFDLTLKTKSIPVLPGGLFTVMAGVPVNGTAAKIVSDGTIGTKQFVYTNAAAPRISLTVTAPVVSIRDSSGPNVVLPVADVTNKRTLVTPAQAVALWQASQKNGANANTLIPDHVTGIATSGTVQLSDQDVNSTTFGAFKLPSPVAVSISGTRPTLNVPGGLNLVSGTTVSFVNSGLGFVQLGTGVLNIAEGAHLTSTTGDLALSGSAATWSVNGELSVSPARSLYLARAATSPLTVSLGTNSQVVGTFGMGPTLDAAVNVKFVAPNAITSRSLALNFGALPLPTLYQAAASAVATAANTRSAASVVFGQGGTGSVSGSLSTTSITIAGVSNKIGTVQTPSSVTISDGSSLLADSNLSVATTGTLTVGTTLSGATGVVLSAGKLNPNGSPSVSFANGTVLAKGDILTPGRFTLSSTGSGGIAIGNGGGTKVNFLENGSKLSIVATAGDITIGKQNSCRVMGGNVVILAKGNITGDVSNKFQAEADGATATGGIELTAGSTTSSLPAAFAAKANNNTRADATTIGTHYVLLNSGSVILGAPNSTLDFTHKGVMTFNGLNGKTVTLPFSAFTTTSSKPIANEEADVTEEFVVDTETDSADAGLCAEL